MDIETRINKVQNNKRKISNQAKFKKTFSNRSTQNRFKKYKKTWGFLTILICMVLIIILFKNKGTNFQIKKSDNVNAHVYYSRGSRDNDKKEQYYFTINDPIQVKIDFKDMQDGDVVVVSLKKVEDEEVKQSVEVPVSSEEGSRFISVSSLARKEVGKYKIEVSINVNGKNKVLEESEFEIR